MPESPLISIIRCDTPNLHGSCIHNRNYLIYIATRDGVDLTDVDLERELQQMEESTVSTSDHADNAHYLKYIKERPGSQGLFGNIDVSNHVALGKHIEDLTAEGRLIYRGVISLREDDAINLGFDKKASWVDYMNLVMPDIAREFNIPVDKLQWAAAFHLKNGHPHCHYMFWNKEEQVASPYIHISKQARCREILSKEMFHLEREEAVLTKTNARDMTIKVTKEFVQDELNILINEPDKLTGFFQTEDVKKLSKELVQFADTLPKSGRLAYKLLPPENKVSLDALTEKMLQTQPLSIDYYRYLHAVDDISASYSASQRHTDVTHQCADEDLKKRMGNVILKACKTLLQEKQRLASYEPDFLQKSLTEPGSPKLNEFDYSTSVPDPEIESEEELTVSPISEPGSPEPHYVMEWNKQYKQARSILYNDSILNKDVAINLLNAEAAKHNVIAIHQLAQLYQRGTSFLAADTEKAAKLYSDAFMGFKQILPQSGKMKPYVSYRLGKYYENGLGTEPDYNNAIEYYKSASDNKYAQFALGSMYLHGKGIEITLQNREYWIKEAAALLKASADESMPYAAYSYAKLCEDESSILSVSNANIAAYYVEALTGFENSVKKQPDDNIFYRLGTMYYAGKGTTPDQERAFYYFTKAAEYNNANAQYALGKTYADATTKYFNLQKAEEMFLLSSAQGNVYATYALGKLYANPESPLYNISLAVQYLTQAAEFDNPNAQYALGKIYLNEENGIYNFQKGFDYLQKSATSGNSYAMAKLGSLYLWGNKDLPANESLGKYWLQKAIENGNEYAQETLTMYGNYQRDIAVSFTFSLCRNLLRLCSSRQRPDNIKEIISRVHTREAAIDAQQKDERTR